MALNGNNHLVNKLYVWLQLLLEQAQKIFGIDNAKSHDVCHDPVWHHTAG